MIEEFEPQIDDYQGKGLEKNAVGLVSSVIIGLASTAPAFSLAATIGWLAIAVGNQSLAVMWVAFIPMAMVALAYRELNRVIPDCGTTFTWATKAFGPHVGWIGGWGLAVSGIIFVANAADIVGIYTLELYGQVTGADTDALLDNKWLVMAIALIFIAVMTWINYRGIEGSARMQYFLVTIQFVALIVVAVIALVAVFNGGGLEGAKEPAKTWFNPFAIHDFEAFVQGILLAIFIYWGWDTVLAINEETKDSEKTPGRAALISTVLLLGIYLFFTMSMISYAGTGRSGLGSPKNADDIFAVIAEPLLGTWGAPVLLGVVLISAAASLQTTIMPTARGTLAMAVYKALPAKFGHVNRFQAPSFSTLMMGVVGGSFYVGFKLISDNILQDTILSIGLAIAFYYGITAFAAAWYFRKEAMAGVRDFFVLFFFPLVGGLVLTAVFFKSAADMLDPDYGYTTLFGVGGVFVMGVGSLLIGVVFMYLWQWKAPPFFRGETLHRDTPVLVPEE
ncbi:MAG: APC family permease [Actinobacteria bacterium]|nr:APC family permease [Actinomycetota bacterium]MCB8996794.1 APC family permease [Actinomycetota bacterium]MCB9414352.1 APC family permease [Actinomycetota bacterium]